MREWLQAKYRDGTTTSRLDGFLSDRFCYKKRQSEDWRRELLQCVHQSCDGAI